MKVPDKFIIIDDDISNNVISELIIRLALGKKVNIKTFTFADDGIAHIENESGGREALEVKTVFLDIDMPVTNGWDALSMLDKLDESIKKQLRIFMLSSSIDQKDRERALKHPLVIDFIEKPLTIEKIGELFQEQ